MGFEGYSILNSSSIGSLSWTIGAIGSCLWVVDNFFPFSEILQGSKLVVEYIFWFVGLYFCGKRFLSSSSISAAIIERVKAFEGFSSHSWSELLSLTSVGGT